MTLRSSRRGRAGRAGRGRAIMLAACAAWLLIVTTPAAGARAADGSPSAGATGTIAPTPPPCTGSLQAMLDAAAPGSTVHLPPCTTTESLEVGRPLVIEAAGTVVDGRGSASHGVVVTADDVTIDGLTVIDVASPQQDGAVRAWDVQRFAFRDGHIAGATGACISVARGAGSSIVGSVLERCGQEGIHATRADQLTVSGNRIAGNNADLAVDPEWEAGGAKVTRSTGVVFEANEVTGNGGPGIWCDIDCRDLRVSGNRVWSNDRAGIQVEISDGAEVAGNAVWENGWGKPAWGWGAGILVSSSRNVDVRNNVLAWNADGIVIVSQDRADAPTPISGDRTSDNVVASQGGYESFALAWLQDWAGGLFASSAGNGSSADQFWYPGPEDGNARFAWDGALTGLDAFVQTAGGVGARYLDSPALIADLESAGIPTEPVAGHVLGPTGPRALIAQFVPLLVLLVALGAVGVLAALLVARRRRARQRSAAPEP